MNRAVSAVMVAALFIVTSAPRALAQVTPRRLSFAEVATAAVQSNLHPARN